MTTGSGSDGAPLCPLCGGGHDLLACPGSRMPAMPEHHPPRAAPDPLVGAMVGSFRVIRLLGRGGMGTVYLAEHPIIGSKVAVKFLHESMSTSPDLVGRFYDEARAVNLIGHENIVAIYDLALLPPNRYYIVMEHLDGATLSALLRAGRVDTSVALEILLQLTDALRAAHERGVVHRDLKPENVFILRRYGRDHFVKLVDFGIAKLAARDSAARTAAGVLVGTPEYMAPEQCDNRPVDRRTDVYALGVMAYELSTGRLPFAGPNVPQVLLAQLRDSPSPPRSVDPSVPPELEEVVLKALSKRPEDRYPDMAAFAAALERVRSALAAQASGSDEPAGRAQEPRRAGLEVYLLRGEAAEPVRATEITRAGLFVCSEGAPPPLLSPVRIRVRADDREVELPGEVVRHVSAADAARWRMEPGFAVQLGPLEAAARAAVDALAARSAPPAASPAPKKAVALAELELHAAAGPYELLGCEQDAAPSEIRERARRLRRGIEALRPTLPPMDQVSRVSALLARIESAASLLGNPSERLLYDARRGNFRGVAQCVTAGTPLAAVEARRRAFLAEQPAREAEAQRHLARAEVARKLGNEAAAITELEAALSADPLDLSLHQRYWELRRAREG